ncbi:MAG: sigma 54-interacting transcriptional regulator [Desulfobacteraceae bacterium]|nr:sigma 54-interacting transcriptional regulator [Desulfobacteraceae bacterium]
MTFDASKRTFIECEHWLDVLEELNIGAFIVDFNRKVRAMNYSAQALMGFSESEVVGTDCREVFWGVPCLVECLVRGDDHSDEAEPDVALSDEADNKYLVTRMATPIFDHNHQMIGCLTILQDHSPIADLIQRVQYDERSMKIVLDNLNVGIFTVNRGGLITFFNKAAETILGYRRDQLLGEPCETLFESDAPADLSLLREAMSDGNARSAAVGRMLTIDGITIPVRSKYLALKNEKERIVGGLVTFHDLTLIHRLTQAVRNQYTFHDMIGKSPAMQNLFETVRVVAGTDATVLIEGETGTGKDLLAKVMHSASPRAEKPIVKVNCAAIPANLLESELFGYVRGAFTGADRDKPGHFQLAHEGTIFLDEIGDLPVALQAKLLRVLEDREFFPLGSRTTQHVDVRIISATNRGLKHLVEQGEFREDLYYRLNVMTIAMPPLRDRREDLPLLISHLVRKLSPPRENPPPGISEEVMGVLLNYDYPGNVRELENILGHALILCRDDVVKIEHLPDFLRKWGTRREPGTADPYHANVSERQTILRMLQRCNGNRGQTAKELGIDRTTLWRKMKKLGIEAPS